MTRYVILGNRFYNGQPVGAMHVYTAPGPPTDALLAVVASNLGFDMRLGVVAVPIVAAAGGMLGRGPQYPYP